MKYLFPGMLIGALLMFIVQGLLEEPSKRVVVQEVRTDTLRVAIPSPPDTVWMEKVKRRLVTVYKDTGSTKVVERVVYRDTTVNVFVSSKTFEWPYVRSMVKAWGPAAVDEFDNSVIVGWDDYAEDNIYPKVQMQLEDKRRRGRWEGLAAGILATAGIVYLVK